MVVKGYLYELNNIFHEQEKDLLLNSETYESKTYHSKVDQIITDYKATKLTREEKSAFNNFQNHFKELKGFENAMVKLDSQETRTKLKSQLNRIQNDLDKLAAISTI